MNGGSSCRTESLVVTLKIISSDSYDSGPVRTMLPNLKPEHLGCKFELFPFAKGIEDRGKWEENPEILLITLEPMAMS